MRKQQLIGAAVAIALAVVSFVAGSSWRARNQIKVEVARAVFFEKAQGQFHWPEDKKERAEMMVPLGSFDFSEYGPRWHFTAMYEGVQSTCDVQVMVHDTEGHKRVAAELSLDRAVPEDIVIDLGALKKNGINLRSVQQLVLRMKSDGRAGRLLVSGLVSPRPALVKQ